MSTAKKDVFGNTIIENEDGSWYIAKKDIFGNTVLEERGGPDKTEDAIAGGIAMLLLPFVIPLMIGAFALFIPFVAFAMAFSILIMSVGFPAGVALSVGLALLFDLLAIVTSRKGKFLWIVSTHGRGFLGFLNRFYALLVALMPWAIIIMIAFFMPRPV